MAPCASPLRPETGAWLRVIDGDTGSTNTVRAAPSDSLERPRARPTLVALGVKVAAISARTSLGDRTEKLALPASSARTTRRVVEVPNARVRRMCVTLDVLPRAIEGSTPRPTNRRPSDRYRPLSRSIRYTTAESRARAPSMDHNLFRR